MFNKIIDTYIDEILELNDNLADNPEIGSEEFLSSKSHVNILRKYGIEVEYPFNNMDTAFHGVINKGKSPKLGILVEYDALRGMGHACGHCASGSISTLAALLLNHFKENIDAEINIYGTPDEEILGGKVYMVKDGVFDELDAAIMIHMSDENRVYLPFIALQAMNYEFYGLPAHAAAAPWEGKNALNALRLTFDALDMARQHLTNDILIHGYIVNGGEASNIVPQYTKAEFCFRANENKSLDYIFQWAKEIGEGAAQMTKTKVVMEEYGERFYDLSSKESGNKLLERIYQKNGLEIKDSLGQIGGSSDIGNVDYVCPAFHPMLSIGEPYKIHTQEFADSMKSQKTHEAIRLGGIVIAEFLEELARNEELLMQIKAEHKRNRS